MTKKYNSKRLQHNQSYNAPNSNKSTQQSDNVSTSNFQWNMETTFFQTKKQRKTHLEVHFRVWSMGLGVLKEPLFILPFKWWIVFFPMESKKRRLIGRGWHCCVKKREVWKWVSQNGYVGKMAKSTRIWKNIEGDGWREVEKFRKVFFFLEKKWWSEEENSSGRRRWIVTMVEEWWRKREKQKKKRERRQRQWGPKFVPPSIDVLSCWVNSGLTKLT